MSAHQELNKAIVRRLHDATNSGALELISKTIDELFEPDAVIRTPLPSDATGAELMKEVWATLLRAYPDLHVRIEDLLADGEKVVSRNTVTGTHLGDYMGHPPTGRPVIYSEIFILRCVGGRIVETWGVVDVLSQMKQIGAMAAESGRSHVDSAGGAA